MKYVYLAAALSLLLSSCVEIPYKARKLNECEWRISGLAWLEWQQGWHDGELPRPSCSGTKFRIRYVYSHEEMLRLSGNRRCGPDFSELGPGPEACDNAQRVWGWAQRWEDGPFTATLDGHDHVLITMWYEAPKSTLIHEMGHGLDYCTGRDAMHVKHDNFEGPVWGPDGVVARAISRLGEESRKRNTCDE